MANDSLDRLLAAFDVHVEAFSICEVRRGFRLTHPPSDAVEVHYVLSVEMHLTVPGTDTIVCEPGCIVIVPPHLIQLMADGCSVQDVTTTDWCSFSRDGLLLLDGTGGGTADLRVICGTVLANLSGSFGLLDKVTIPFTEDLSKVPFVQQAFAVMLQEINHPTQGTRALVGALMKACLLMGLRRYYDDPKSRASLHGLSHPSLGKAVLAILDKPAVSHTVATLAAAAGMSRSTFAREFAISFRLTPMEFVARSRLHHAAELLRSTAVSIKVIAASSGFASRSHFSRAFRNVYGTDPRDFRRKGQSHRRPGSPLSIDIAKTTAG